MNNPDKLARVKHTCDEDEMCCPENCKPASLADEFERLVSEGWTAEKKLVLFIDKHEGRIARALREYEAKQSER